MRPHVILDKQTERYIRQRQTLVARFKESKLRAKLRDALLSQHPHCDNCGCPLQGTDPHAEDYANVVAEPGRLSCRRCVKIVRALAIVESEAQHAD